MINIRVNGEDKKMKQDTTISTLLQELGIGGRRVAVERNRKIVKRTDWDKTIIEENDIFEIIEFVGGGI